MCKNDNRILYQGGGRHLPKWCTKKTKQESMSSWDFMPKSGVYTKGS